HGDGFDLNGSRAGTIESTFAPTCFDPCRAGDTVDFSFMTLPAQFLGSGSATFGGSSYTEVFYRGELSFEGDAVRFPSTNDEISVQVSQRFVFTGFLQAFLNPEFTELAFATNLEGRGNASTRYFQVARGAFIPEEGQIVYDFVQPVPEPSTLLLIGSGVAYLGLKRRVRARSHRRSRQ
ncbi:MAG TPA: PEP-CTERM sorting domain-containing protein, partial [Pyrinomonadaceae bacterium]|nr:PEP-CTERM sorting domain-containing protein [Pyrinomonadaceae bacterium]